MERALVRETSSQCLIPTPKQKNSPRSSPAPTAITGAFYRSGSKLTWGGLASGVELVRKPGNTAVGDLTVTVEAGTKFADLQAILAKLGNFSPSIQLPQRQQQ